jgi:hypothetical protein
MVVVTGADVEIVAEVEDDEAPCAPCERPRGEAELQLGTAVEFIGTALAQSFTGRYETGRDAWLEGTVRVHPGCWTGRTGAGIDVFGDGPLDLNFGLFVGASGPTVSPGRRPEIGAAPQAGGQAALGLDGRHLFARYTWIAGWGGGRLDDALTENQLVVGFRVARIAEIYGEYLVLAPGDGEGGTGIGLGARIVL